MNSMFMKVWFGAILSLLSSLLPTWLVREKAVMSRPQVVLTVPAPRPMVKHLIKHLSKPVPAVPAAPVQPTVLCELSGRAMNQGIPYGKADLDVWITSPLGQEMRHIKTDADGSYHLALNVPIRQDEPLDWEIQAQTENLETIHRSGRRIIREAEPTVAIQNTFEFSAD